MRNLIKIFLVLVFIFSFFGCQKNRELIKNKIRENNINNKNIEKNTFFKQNKKIISLDKKLDESSGLLYFDKKLWTFNDSGGKSEIYEIDKKTGKILQIKKIINAKNIDWEDITQSEKYIFIGDIGNNKGKRKKLQIYKISKKDFLEKNEIIAEKIEFSYKNFEEQKNLKNKNLEKINLSKYDSESLIYYKKNLYIFSKGWGDYIIRIYKIDLSKKNIIAEKIQEKNLGLLITGASSYNGKIFLVGYNSFFVDEPSVIILKDFESNKFFCGKIEKKQIFKNFISSQIEAIDLGGNKIFLTNEKDKRAILKKQSLIYFDYE